jgi:outer membrane protein TolC
MNGIEIGKQPVRMGWNPRSVWTPGLLGLALAAAPALKGQVSLGTVVSLAQRNSAAVRMADADVAKARAQLSESKDVVIPSVLFSTGLPVFPEVGFTGTPPSIWSGSVQSLIFSVPQKRYIDAARLGLQAASSRLKDAREQVALDASTEYIEFDTVNRNLAAAREQQGFADRLVEIEQQRAEAGVDPLSEMLQAKLLAAQVKLKREQLGARAATLAKQLAVLTGLPLGSILPDHASIPEIPQVRGDVEPGTLPAIESAEFLARSKQRVAKGDQELNYMPQLSFGLQYYRDTNLLNSVNQYFKVALPANNFSSGISIQIPLFDMGHRAKAKESAADALRATIEAEDAQKQNDLQITMLNGSLRELDTLAEIAELKQQIAAEELKTVLTELQTGNGAGNAPGAPAQLTPKDEQRARIQERERYEESLDAGLELAKARLGLLRALGHMQDWLSELHTK